MSKRKDQLRSLFGVEPAPETKQAEPHAPEVPKRSTSGAVKAMGLSLDTLSQEIADARRLRESLDGADRVVELEPERIERSPYADRLSSGAAGDEHFEALVHSIAEQGQQVPVLVRPHPDSARGAAGEFQAAYGHRRIEAARRIGKPVRAIVKAMTDAELATAQGKENAERRDLSYIERAFFADGLMRHGFDRATAMAALAVDKTELSRLLQVATVIPGRIAVAVGPAPKVGRPRWMAFAALLDREAQYVKADDEIATDRFRRASSDERFQMLFDRLSQRAPKKAAATQVQSAGGGRIAEVQRKADRAVFVIPASAGAGFADYVEAELPKLHAAFSARSGEGG
ncbi:plasmid partitioning protein RepB [Arvimicrobium flavum]|uniref:plasmid partitioning protein RepB n=1 Tax=Arvimicrobium flavum TaxID=3393320 RepID=UPI00237B306F|nr:plasmid partitioning protein RepB [Mesorhizobium shangrilense]